MNCRAISNNHLWIDIYKGLIKWIQKNYSTYLEETGVPDELYSLHETGRDDERFCLCKEGEQWQVYFLERGVKTTNKVFNTETEACQYIYEQLIDG